MYDRVLVATDGSQGADAAFRRAIELAEAADATVHVLFVVDATVTDRAHEEFLRERGESITNEWVVEATRRGLAATAAVRTGLVHEEIVAYATDNAVDLVVVGTSGRGGIERHLLGSVADRVVRTSPVPVMTVPADG